MKHFLLLYLFLTFSIGLAALIITFIIFFITKKGRLKYYLYFYSSFTLFIFITLFENYMTINNLMSGGMVLSTVRQIGIFSLALIHFSAPVYINYIVRLKWAKQMKVLFALLAGGGYVAYQIYALTSKTVKPNYYSVLYIGEALIMIVLVYIVITVIVNWKNISDPLIAKHLRLTLIAIVIFIPFIVNDFLHYLPLPNGINFFPLLYCWFSVSQIIYITRTYLVTQVKSGQAGEPGDAFFEKYNMSKREREIFLLLIKGKTNKQIGEQLFISPFTVKTYTSKIYKKTGVNSRFELISLLQEKMST